MAPIVVVYDLSSVRNVWEGRIKKHKERQRRERERQEKSALAKINEEWTLRLERRRRTINKYIQQRKDLMNGEVHVQMNHLTSPEKDTQLVGYGNLILPESRKNITIEDKRFIFELQGIEWKELPDTLKDKTYLKEWHIKKTSLEIIPSFIVMFQDLIVMNLSRNCIKELPAEIGKMTKLKELNVGFNKLTSVPLELGCCENLEKLNLSSNLELTELPFELRDLQKLSCLDLSSNQFHSMPICVLRMSNLKSLDISNNKLKDLPQDLDRLNELESLFLQKNKLTYLSKVLCRMTNLKMLVVSGDDIKNLPTSLTTDPNLKYIDLRENPLDSIEDEMLSEIFEDDEDQEEFEKDLMRMYFKDLKERVPYGNLLVTSAGSHNLLPTSVSPRSLMPYFPRFPLMSTLSWIRPVKHRELATSLQWLVSHRCWDSYIAHMWQSRHPQISLESSSIAKLADNFCKEPYQCTRGELQQEPHDSLRAIIEQAIGLLKMQFRCFDRSGGVLQYIPPRVSEWL
ncbi:leucine-rich repeat-containing protein 2 [Heterodontus francisci]|uniref:leucine-rich repeat-containing protein 2 n=1 Tax=Heterodontus francisci TaxID=7792 RepID=UPI00355B7D76